MPRPHVDLRNRTITLDSGRRSVDIPVDSGGHLRRAVKLSDISLARGSTSTDSIGFRGHAAVFDVRAQIGGKRWGFKEEIAPGAFKKTLQESDTKFLHNHDPNLILARKVGNAPNQTLRIAEDDIGLSVDADLAPTSYGQDLALSLERGDITQMSFAFDMITYEWSELPDGTELLRHTEVGPLYDVSTVTYPAYVETDAGLRFDFLACARASGLNETLLSELARRLADPDPEFMDSLRVLARGGVLLEATIEPDSSTRNESTIPPDSTTELQTRTLQLRHKAVAQLLERT